MEEQPTNRQWQTIEIPAREFSKRLSQFSETQTATGALFSRLALIHRVAKVYAVEAMSELGHSPTDLEIEEITDPPLYGHTIDDDPVFIQFSYFK
ncbi:hypothetical protein [Spirosoma validum]|uniref:Uncharacterized protein n=1 Tax=Spirosoma validum TaxID=2771355 RepID=A0A927GGA6_9BACT|nr:hypothetical protein [Spirosoma validum]MBD2756671.1 hypothetical protein [Spirosoma validum]